MGRRRGNRRDAPIVFVLGLPPGRVPRARDGSLGSGPRRASSGAGSRWCGSERTRAYLSVVLRGAEEVGADGVDLAVVLRDANLADVARAHRSEAAVRAHRGRPLGDAHRVTGDRAGGLTEHGAREERDARRRRVRRARRCDASTARYFQTCHDKQQLARGAHQIPRNHERLPKPHPSHPSSGRSPPSILPVPGPTRVYSLLPVAPPMALCLAARSSSVGSVAITFPGFIMHLGSSARLILLCAST